MHLSIKWVPSFSVLGLFLLLAGCAPSQDELPKMIQGAGTAGATSPSIANSLAIATAVQRLFAENCPEASIELPMVAIFSGYEVRPGESVIPIWRVDLKAIHANQALSGTYYFKVIPGQEPMLSSYPGTGCGTLKRP